MKIMQVSVYPCLHLVSIISAERENNHQNRTLYRQRKKYVLYDYNRQMHTLHELCGASFEKKEIKGFKKQYILKAAKKLYGNPLDDAPDGARYCGYVSEFVESATTVSDKEFERFAVTPM